MTRRRPLAALLLAALLAPRAASGDEPPPGAAGPPPPEEFLVIPLRVHVLTAEDLPEIDCKLSDDDVRRIVGKVNRIWHEAGIHFGLESIVREPAAHQGRFRAARDLGDGPPPPALYRVLLPESGRRPGGLHVYYIHEFSVNGVYMGDDFAIVRETARLRPVEGGIDEPVPRVTAHELGHALGLRHRQDRTNLLASGTTGTLLNRDETARRREGAREIKGALAPADLRRAAAEAERAGDGETARRLRGWLDEIPGPDAGAPAPQGESPEQTHRSRGDGAPGPGGIKP